MKILGSIVLGLFLASPTLAQSSASVPEVRQLHYQLDMMERVLEAAVAHGAVVIRDRLQTVAPEAPSELLILDSPRVRGFKLEPYGVFFDVEVPSLNATLTWSLKTLQDSDSGLQTALNTLRNRIDPSDAELQQAFQRVAVRVNSSAPAAPAAAPEPTRTLTPTLPNTRRPAANPGDRQVSAASLAPGARAAAEPDNILENPNEAYRNEVIKALSDAMLDYSGALPVGDSEWLTIAARGASDRPAGNDAATIMIRVRGVDLAAFRARQISRDEVLKRIERRVF
jgi:hypothetical protein